VALLLATDFAAAQQVQSLKVTEGGMNAKV
jgi:hypothetical protein